MSFRMISQSYFINWNSSIPILQQNNNDLYCQSSIYFISDDCKREVNSTPHWPFLEEFSRQNVMKSKPNRFDCIHFVVNFNVWPHISKLKQVNGISYDCNACIWWKMPKLCYFWYRNARFWQFLAKKQSKNVPELHFCAFCASLNCSMVTLTQDRNWSEFVQFFILCYTRHNNLLFYYFLYITDSAHLIFTNAWTDMGRIPFFREFCPIRRNTKQTMTSQYKFSDNCQNLRLNMLKNTRFRLLCPFLG